MNRSLMQTARCLIFEANMSKEFWGEAVLTAMYLINRTKTSALKGEIPFERWNKEKVNLSKIKVFGSSAFVHVPKEESKGKLEARKLS